MSAGWTAWESCTAVKRYSCRATANCLRPPDDGLLFSGVVPSLSVLFDLAVRFSENGADVVKLPEGHLPLLLPVRADAADGDKVVKRVVVRKTKG